MTCQLADTCATECGLRGLNQPWPATKSYKSQTPHKGLAISIATILLWSVHSVLVGFSIEAQSTAYLCLFEFDLVLCHVMEIWWSMFLALQFAFSITIICVKTYRLRWCYLKSCLLYRWGNYKISKHLNSKSYWARTSNQCEAPWPWQQFIMIVASIIRTYLYWGYITSCYKVIRCTNVKNLKQQVKRSNI